MCNICSPLYTALFMCKHERTALKEAIQRNIEESTEVTKLIQHQITMNNIREVHKYDELS